jgi:HlyD family secretion protein
MIRNQMVLLCVLVWWGSACHSKKVEMQPQMRLMTEAVYASGTLVPEKEYQLMPTTQGVLQQAFVKEGDTIRKGQLLFALTNEDRRTEVSTASSLVQRTLPVAAPNAPSIKDLETKLESARASLQNDSLLFIRYKNLYAEHAISASTYEKYQLAYQTSQDNVKSLEEEVQAQRLNADIQLQQATNALEIARTSKNDGLLRSQTSGVVFEIYKQTGDLVAANQSIALIGSGQMMAKLLVDEDDLEKVKMGAEVLITLDAYPNKIFHAHVAKIYPLLDKQEQSFRVDAYFDDDMPVKLYGLNMEANILVRQKAMALVIPRKALLAGDSVLVRQGDRLTRIKILKGAEDNEFVQVLGGLSLSSKVIVEQ